MGSSKCFSASSTEINKGCMVIINALQKDGEKNAQWSFKWQTMGFVERLFTGRQPQVLFILPPFCFILAMHYVCLCNTCPITPKLFLCLLHKWEVGTAWSHVWNDWIMAGVDVVRVLFQ